MTVAPEDSYFVGSASTHGRGSSPGVRCWTYKIFSSHYTSILLLLLVMLAIHLTLAAWCG